MSGEVKNKEFISDDDKRVLDNVRMRRALLLAQAENAELTCSNIVLQLTIKYKLNDTDVITDQGEIIRKTTQQVEEVK